MGSRKPSKKLLKTFVKEAEGHLELVASLLHEDAQLDEEYLGEIQNALHQLKGASSMVGFDELADVAGNLEEFIKSDPKLATHPQSIDFAAAGITALGRMIANVKIGEQEKNKELYNDFMSAWRIAQHLIRRMTAPAEEETDEEGGERQKTRDSEDEEELRQVFIEETREKLGDISYNVYCLTTNPNDEAAFSKLNEQWSELIIETKTVAEDDLAKMLELGKEFLKKKNLVAGANICATAIEKILNLFDDALSALESGEQTLEAFLLETGSLVNKFKTELEEARSRKKEQKPSQERATETESEAQTAPLEAPAAKPDKIDPELLEFFLPEAREYLDELNRLLLKWEDNLEDGDIIYRLFRCTHSLKGSAATVGFNYLSSLAHAMEDRFAAIRDKKEKPTQETLQYLFESADKLTQTLVEASGEIKGQLEEARLSEAAAETPIEAAEELGGAAAKSLRIQSEDIDRLFDVTAEMVQSHSRLKEMQMWLMQLEQDFRNDREAIRQLIDRIVSQYEYSLNSTGFSQRAVGAETADPLIGGDFAELEFDKYDDINILARRLDEIGFSASGTAMRLEAVLNEFSSQMETLGGLIDSAKEQALNLRMVQMESIFSRLHRPLRDAAVEEGKEVSLKLKGEENKIDKVIAEALLDPLVQLIRNGIAHGIEKPEERIEKGKPVEGAIEVAAITEGRRILISVSDDGKGIDPEEIRNILINKKIIDSELADSLNDLKIVDAVFLPGISTRTVSDSLAGRGVGLDIVRQTVTRFGGAVSVVSNCGKGSVFTLSVPLTLAIIPVLMVEVGDNQLALPLDAVITTGRLMEDELLKEKGRKYYEYNGQKIPALDMCEIWNAGPKEALSHISNYVLLAAGDKSILLLVDELLRIDEVVIRPLGEFFKNIQFFSGAAIGGDGTLRLILNPQGIYKLVSTGFSAETDLLQRSRIKRALLVDDSLSIRQVIGGFIQDGGYRVDVAVDGQDAWEKLKVTKYDLVMTDLEMPRMHGYELIHKMKNHLILRQLPIVIISSRSGQKHREKAFEMGAKAYITKPANKRQIIAVLDEILGSPISK